MDDNLASPSDTDTDLEWGQAAYCFRAGCKGASCGKPVPNFADGNGTNATSWLGNREEASAQKAEEVGQIPLDHGLDDAQHRGFCILAASCGGLDVPICPSTGPR
jgi:hypothetical protein